MPCQLGPRKSGGPVSMNALKSVGRMYRIGNISRVVSRRRRGAAPQARASCARARGAQISDGPAPQTDGLRRQSLLSQIYHRILERSPRIQETAPPRNLGQVEPMRPQHRPLSDAHRSWVVTLAGRRLGSQAEHRAAKRFRPINPLRRDQWRAPHRKVISNALLDHLAQFC